MARYYRWEKAVSEAAGTYNHIVDTTQENAETGKGRTGPDLLHRYMSFESNQKTSEKFSSPESFPSPASVNSEYEQSEPSPTSNNVTNPSACSPSPPYCNGPLYPLQMSIGRCL